MPPLPPSSAGVGRSCRGRRLRGRRFGRRRSRSCSVVSVVSVVGSVVSVVGARRLRCDRRRRVAAAVVAAGDHDDRDHEADDHGDQAGDEQAHVAVRRCSPGSSGRPIIRVGSSCIRLFLRSENRVEDLACVLDLESVAQPHLDLLAAAAGDRHLRGQQARRGGAAAGRRPRRSAAPASGAGGDLERIERRSGRRPLGLRAAARCAARRSSSSAASRRRSATIRSARACASSR